MKPASVSSLLLVRFDTNNYSVPVKYAHRKVLVVATVDEIRLVHEDRLIARHPRHSGREKYLFEPVDYLHLGTQARRVRLRPASGELEPPLLLRHAPASS